MIELKDLAKHFENALNLNNLIGRQFIIQADTGELKQSKRIDNTTQGYINGIMRLTGSTIENTNPSDEEEHAGEIAVINTITTLIMPCEDTKEENETMVKACRKTIDKVTSQNSLFSINGQVIGATYGLGVSGARESIAGLGECFMFVIHSTYFYVVNGVYSRELKVFFKTEEMTDYIHIPYQEFIPFRQTIQESELFANKQSIDNLPTATSFGISIKLPLMNNEVGRAIYNYIIGEENSKLNVKIQGLGSDRSYFMGFDRGQFTAQGVACVGCEVSMSERW